LFGGIRRKRTDDTEKLSEEDIPAGTVIYG
jgi:hypothetical protein